jgi:hypothetical protein
MLQEKFTRLGQLMHEFAQLTSNLENEMILASDNAAGLEAKAVKVAELDDIIAQKKAEIVAAASEYASIKAKFDALIGQIQGITGRA